jgi:Zn-dependent protease with chaperone function
MNFARQQEQAERAGRRLMWLHGLTTLAVALTFDAAAMAIWHLLFGDVPPPRGFLLTNTGVVLGLVAGGAWLETTRLRADGALIARRLGAVPVDTLSDPLHRRLQNLLEELAIAARIGVPRAFVLEDEPTINALTAGFDRNQAVVVVTRGALSRLTRDELQGVLAHEVSHIVNGDVRLNTRLVAMNHGLELVALFGRWMLSRAGAILKGGPIDPISGAALLPLALAGGTLAAVGSIGVLGARAIKAGVGRQREFFADAQAVAFTRHADGLGGALRKVAGLARRLQREAVERGGAAQVRIDPRREAALRHPYWQNVSHLLLVGPTTSRRWFATHPSLRDRLHRIYGRYRDALDPVPLVEAQRHEPELPVFEFHGTAAGSDADVNGSGLAGLAGYAGPAGHRAYDGMRGTRDARDMHDTHGAPVIHDTRDAHDTHDTRDAYDTHDTHDTHDAQNTQYTQNTQNRSDTHDPHDTLDTRDTRKAQNARDTHRAQVTRNALAARPDGHDDAGEDRHDGEPDARTPQAAPMRLVQATRDPAGSAALVVALLQEPGSPAPRWGEGWECAASRHSALRAAVGALPEQSMRTLRWPLIELAVARLRPLSMPSRESLLATVRDVVVADGRVTLGEWIYFLLLRLRLAPRRSGPRLRVLADPIDARSVRVLFALVAHAAHVSETRADRAANAAIRSLNLAPIGGSAGALTLAALERAVLRVAQLPPLARPLLVKQLVAVLPPDADTSVRDFLRVLCLAIDCPPPDLPPRLHPPTVPLPEMLADTSTAR